MKLAYFVNYLNHHRIELADELFKLLGEDFVLIATMPWDEKELKGGVDYRTKPYCLLAAEKEESMQLAMKYAREAEACSFGANSMKFSIERAKNGRMDGISFDTGERWLKKGFINIFSPRLLKWWWTYQTIFRSKKYYKLCASAFAARDHNLLGTYRGRCYKWGYFTSVSNNVSDLENKESTEIPTIMWCGRFLRWKHPELPVLMAKQLKDKGYKFHIYMYGDEGNAAKYDAIYPRVQLEGLISGLGVRDCVHLKGSRPNSDIIDAMREASIFLFTSDRNEGWGAVANEAMSNGCVLIASDMIGSAPYLVRDGQNGLLFRDRDVDSLSKKVEWLLNHPLDQAIMQKNAYLDMVNLWSPQVAARNLLKLIDDLRNGRDSSIEFGPCSKA